MNQQEHRGGKLPSACGKQSSADAQGCRGFPGLPSSEIRGTCQQQEKEAKESSSTSCRNLGFKTTDVMAVGAASQALYICAGLSDLQDTGSDAARGNPFERHRETQDVLMMQLHMGHWADHSYIRCKKPFLHSAAK